MAEALLANQPIVIDNGSGLIKAGFAGSDRPTLVFPSYVGRPKHLKAMAGGVDGDHFVGQQATDLRGILKLNYPMRHGIVHNWDDMQHLWQHCYSSLNAVQEEHPVLLTEAPLNPQSNRATTAEVFFERFQVPAVYVAVQAILALYASGRTTGVVLDAGDGITHAVPVFEGFALPHAITRMDVAGHDVTEYMRLLLRKSGCVFHTTAEMETVKHIKETTSVVSFNIEKSERELLDEQEGTMKYKLPDGNEIEIGPEKFRAPEVLFKPELIGLEYEGVHHTLVNAIKKSDLDIRRTLYQQIVLSGGSTMFLGFGDRLLAEVRKLAPKDTKIRIYAPQDRMLSTWIGGSILASLATFKKMWVTRKEYEDQGASVMYRKSL